MKIAFLLGSAAISGGTYVIFEHAMRLRKSGHQLTILTKETVEPEVYAWHPGAADLRWLNYTQGEKDHFDVVLATWWQSPFLLKDFVSNHYAYFVQSIETRFFEEPDPTDYGTRDHAIWQQLCERTYSYAIPMITEARWIQDYLYDNYNTRAALVRNGIRKDIYTQDGQPIAPREAGKLRVLIEGPVDVPYKNVPSAIALAREAQVDEVWLLTSSDVKQYPDVDRVFSQIPIHDTPAIYRSCDVLVKLSYVEGMFGPPLEMFHCGGTAIVYKVTGHDEYIVHGQNSLVADRDDAQGVVRGLQQLKNDPSMLARLKSGAMETARQWPDWEDCSAEFEKALVSITQQERTSRTYLKNYTKTVLDLADILVNEKTLHRFSYREKRIAQGKKTEKQNFVELYWHCEDFFKSENVKWQYYSCEEWATVSFEVSVTGFPFWLRIDPSTRIGCVELASVKVNNMDTGKCVLALKDAEDYGAVLLSGSAYWIDHARKNVIFSFGADPAMVLPALDETMASMADRLQITVKLREMPIQHFFQENKGFYEQVCQQRIAAVVSPDVSCKQKIIQCLKGLPHKFFS